MQTGNSASDQPSNQQQRKKRGQSKFSRDVPKYQCYCTKMYQSYPALYLHLKNKHPECFSGNKKVQSNKFITYTTNDGYKVHKMDKAHMERQLNHSDQNIYTKQSQFKDPSMPYHLYDNYPSQPSRPSYMESRMGIRPQSSISDNNQIFKTQQTRQGPGRPPKGEYKKPDNVTHLLNLYFFDQEWLKKFDFREKKQAKILFTLMIRCIRQRAHQIRVHYNIPQLNSLLDLTQVSEFKYLESVIPYFQKTYIPQLINSNQKIKVEHTSNSNESSDLQFYITHSKLMKDPKLLQKFMGKFAQWLIKRKIIQKIDEQPLFLQK